MEAERLRPEDVAETDEFVLALRRGEERALVDLYERYGTAVYHLALRITRDAGAAEEISLDSFLQLWRHADRFSADQGTLSSWLFTIARSRAIDRVRAAAAAKRITAAQDTLQRLTQELASGRAIATQRRGRERALRRDLDTQRQRKKISVRCVPRSPSSRNPACSWHT